ncbi:hypothetical protein AVEN_190448-1, partial [Araneus ventricosus]
VSVGSRIRDKRVPDSRPNSTKISVVYVDRVYVKSAVGGQLLPKDGNRERGCRLRCIPRHDYDSNVRA